MNDVATVVHLLAQPADGGCCEPDEECNCCDPADAGGCCGMVSV